MKASGVVSIWSSKVKQGGGGGSTGPALSSRQKAAAAAAVKLPPVRGGSKPPEGVRGAGVALRSRKKSEWEVEGGWTGVPKVGVKEPGSPARQAGRRWGTERLEKECGHGMVGRAVIRRWNLMSMSREMACNQMDSTTLQLDRSPFQI